MLQKSTKRSNLYRFFFGTASKKSKLISNNNDSGGVNTTIKNHHQHKQPSNEHLKKTKASGKVHHQQTGANIPSVDVEQQSNQDHESLYNGSVNDLKRGPNLVNKQLVLPIIAFPNSIANDSNHLIKPSEYLKSIVSSDKRPSTR
jgi:hypothetical protein